MGINRFRLLARMLSQLQGERYRGAVIMRAGWRREASLPEGERTPAILQDRHGMMKICCRSGHEELMVTLLLGRGADCRATDAESSVFGGEDKARQVCFSASAIRAFTLSVGDTNEIHQGAHPVVPGLMIMEAILEETPCGAAGLMVRFHHPVWAGWAAVDPDGYIVQQGERKADFRWLGTG